MAMPRSEEIDDSMLMHFLKEQRKRRLIIKHGLPFDFEPVKKSYTELYEMVMKERSDAKKKKALSHETFRDHLNRLVLESNICKISQR